MIKFSKNECRNSIRNWLDIEMMSCMFFNAFLTALEPKIPPKIQIIREKFIFRYSPLIKYSAHTLARSLHDVYCANNNRFAVVV